ncbi:MAG: exosortase/archaeosortase family protein [Phycisphaerales bacterium]
MNLRRSWKFSDGVLLVGLAALAVFAARDIWQNIFTVGFGDEEQSHILIAPVVVVWLAWLRRDRLRLTPHAPSIWGPLVIAGGYGLSVYGFSDGLDLFWHSGAILMLVGAVLTVTGPRVLWKFLPAVVALAFLLPIPGRLRRPIANTLQDASAQATEFLLDIFAVPVARSGNLLTINGYDVAVAEACNGMRMVAALALVSFAFVFSVPMRTSVRILILLISPLIALIVNVIRLIPTVLMYGYSTEDRAQLFHDISGWATDPNAHA